MSHGSCVAAREGVAPPASSPPSARVAAATVSSAFLVCRNRGLTVIVDPVLSSLPRAFLTFWAAAEIGRSARQRHASAPVGGLPPLLVLAITSIRLYGIKPMAYRTSVSVNANKWAVNEKLGCVRRSPVSP